MNISLPALESQARATWSSFAPIVPWIQSLILFLPLSHFLFLSLSLSLARSLARGLRPRQANVSHEILIRICEAVNFGYAR